MEIFSFIPYLTEILTIVLAAHAVALAIVNLTDTPKDNEAVEFVYKIIEYVTSPIAALKLPPAATLSCSNAACATCRS